MNIKLTNPYTRGDAVLHIQLRLIAHGYHADPDGIYGSRTCECVMKFQTAEGLDADGIVGPLTLAALDAAPAAAEEPSELALQLVEHCREHVGDLYVWGADGQIVSGGSVEYRGRIYTMEAFCKFMDDSDAKAQRSIDLYKKKLSYGQTDMYMYDCSGLISIFLQMLGFVSAKRNCNHLWSMATPISRAELIPGDLLFRQKSTGHNYHVGVYAGRGMVIEAMGRDTGVVCRGIDQSNRSYWTHQARLAILYEGVKEK